MYPIILRLHKNLAIQSYGVAIALGLIIAYLLAKKEITKKSLITVQTLDELTTFVSIAVLIGGRIWHRITEPELYSAWYEAIIPWTGGFSVMGSMIAALCVGIWYVRINSLPLWKILDLVGAYAPLVQGFGRIGCFLAGCCFGTQTTIWWGISYTNPDVLAPLFCPLHPTQLYSALLFFILFALLQIYKKQDPFPGSIGLVYLIGASTERFILDFLRGDQIAAPLFSVNQWIALILALLSSIIFIYRMRSYGSFSLR
jgi:phosphatidylglycerol:prolipoprotein diacylglycerol transferase